MLQLFAEDQQLDIGLLSFNIHFKNPLFAFSGYQGSFIFNFPVPATLRNRKIFHILDPLQTSDLYSADLSFRIVYKGLTLVDQSTVSIKNVTGTTIQLNAKIGSGSFHYLAQDIKLNGLDLGAENFDDNAALISRLNYTADKFYPEVPYALPTINCEPNSLIPEEFTGWSYRDTINVYLNNTYQVLDGTDRRILVPMLYLQYVLKKIFENFGYSYIDLFFPVHDDFKNLILFNIYNLNGMVGTPEDPGYIPDPLHINYSNHVPHVKIIEFIHGLQLLLNAGFFFNHLNKQVTCTDLNSILNDPDYIDFSNNVLINPKSIHHGFDGFRLTMKPDKKDAYYNEQILPWDDFNEFAREDGEFKIETPFTPLLNNSTYGDMNAWISIPGNSYKEIMPRVMFYRGLVAVAGGTQNRPVGYHSSGDYTLFWKDEDGLYNRRYSNLIPWWTGNKKEVEFMRIFSPSEIQQLDLSKKVRIRDRLYLVKEIKIPFKNNILQPAKILGYEV